MADHSLIEWTDATWNPVTGCSVVSPGCTNCYAMRLAGTRLKHHPTRAGLTRDSRAGPVWTGEVRFNEKQLLEPLTWKRPRRIFVCAHGDLFHESVPDAWIDKAFAVMALCPQHTFQVLTKRSARMLRFFTAHRRAPPDYDKHVPGHTPVMRLQALIADFVRLGRFQSHGYGPVYAEDKAKARDRMRSYPLPNVWLGVSAERQQEADARIPDLLATPAAVRFVSLEPLLGPIDLDCVPWPVGWQRPIDDLSDGIDPLRYAGRQGSKLDWVIVGGESQAGARPMHPDWARSIRDQCAAVGVPFFFKQWGDWLPWPQFSEAGVDDDPEGTRFATVEWNGERFEDVGYPAWMDWVDGAVDDEQCFGHVGKKRAGRLLDGVEHNGMPSAHAPGGRLPAGQSLGASDTEPAEA